METTQFEDFSQFLIRFLSIVASQGVVELHFSCHRIHHITFRLTHQEIFTGYHPNQSVFFRVTRHISGPSKR